MTKTGPRNSAIKEKNKEKNRLTEDSQTVYDAEIVEQNSDRCTAVEIKAESPGTQIFSYKLGKAMGKAAGFIGVIYNICQLWNRNARDISYTGSGAIKCTNAGPGKRKRKRNRR